MVVPEMPQKLLPRVELHAAHTAGVDAVNLQVEPLPPEGCALLHVHLQIPLPRVRLLAAVALEPASLQLGETCWSQRGDVLGIHLYIAVAATLIVRELEPLHDPVMPSFLLLLVDIFLYFSFLCILIVFMLRLFNLEELPADDRLIRMRRLLMVEVHVVN